MNLQNKPIKVSRSLSFSALFPLSSKKGKLKISKFGSNSSLNRRQSEQFTKLNRDAFNGRVLEDIHEADSNMKRLSIVVNEIEQFEKEFVHPMKKSVSSFNISETARQRRPQEHQLRGLNRYFSANILGRSRFHSSTDSVISEYDSGAYSRESTPDFSLVSSFTDVSEPLVSPGLVMSFNNKIIEGVASTEGTSNLLNLPDLAEIFEEEQTDRPVTFTEVVFANTYRTKFDRFEKYSHGDSRSVEQTNLFSSTPKLNKRPGLSKSQSLLLPKTPTVLKRSKTSVGFSWACAVNCDSEVTVNGLCYH